MRSQIMVIGRDVNSRARLARLLSREGYRAEVAESLAHARRAGLEGIALAIVAPDLRNTADKAVIEEVRAAVGRVLVIASSGGTRAEPDVIDIKDEPGLLTRISESLAPTHEPQRPELVLEFAGYHLDLAGHSLTDQSGNDIPLTHGEFSLLRTLVERAGRVLSRDQLLQLIAGREAEPYDRSIDMLVARLRRKIEADAKRPGLIGTVPGTGYKFAAAVREAKPTAARTAKEPLTRSDISQVVGLAAEPPASPALPDKPSIAVLPFQNMSGDPEQDYFADGMVDDTLPRASHGSGGSSSSRAIRAPSTRAARSTSGRPDASLGCAICLKVASANRADVCASPPSSSRPKPARICGPTSSTASSKTFSICRIASPSGWSASSSRACRGPRWNGRAASPPRVSTLTIFISELALRAVDRSRQRPDRDRIFARGTQSISKLCACACLSRMVAPDPVHARWL